MPGPQTQLLTVVPKAGCRQAEKVVAAVLQGAKNTVPFAPLAIACVVTVTRPPPVAPGLDAAVEMLFTYLVPDPVETSQPQPSAPIVVPEDAD